MSACWQFLLINFRKVRHMVLFGNFRIDFLAKRRTFLKNDFFWILQFPHLAVTLHNRQASFADCLCQLLNEHSCWNSCRIIWIQTVQTNASFWHNQWRSVRNTVYIILFDWSFLKTKYGSDETIITKWDHPRDYIILVGSVKLTTQRADVNSD